MTVEERYLFDLQGYMVLEDVLKADELRDLNQVLDEYNLWNESHGQGGFFDSWRNGDHQVSAGPVHRFAKPFRQLLGHARIVPYLTDLLGKQFRFDHGHAMIMKKGGEALALHGGGAPKEPGIRYEVADGQIRSELLVVEYALCDVAEGDGGLCVVPGSHKSNFACPSSLASLEQPGAWLRNVPQKAGSAVIFTEALTHGTLPWTADHERRAFFIAIPRGIWRLWGVTGKMVLRHPMAVTLSPHTAKKAIGVPRNGASSKPRIFGNATTIFRKAEMSVLYLCAADIARSFGRRSMSVSQR